MTDSTQRYDLPKKKSSNPEQSHQGNSRHRSSDSYCKEIVSQISDCLRKLKASEDKDGHLKEYQIRDLVKHTEIFGSKLKEDGLTTSQIRKFFDAVHQIRAKAIEGRFELDDVLLLKPKLAYAAGRQKQVKPLEEVMSLAIDYVQDEKDFERFVQLIESTVAYHKAAGGKDQ